MLQLAQKPVTATFAMSSPRHIRQVATVTVSISTVAAIP